MKKPNHYRSRLLTSTCAFALAIAGGSASAQEIAIAEGNYVVGINQAFNGFADATASITAITGQQDLVRDVTVGFLVNGDVADSSLVVGGPTGNTTSASLTVNLAETSLNSDVTNDEFGTAGGSAIASTQLASPIDVPRAAAETLSADLGIATSQNVNNTAAAVTNASDIAIVAQDDLLTSTAEVANNTQESVGLLNRNTTTLNSAANSTDASTAISTSQNVTTDLPSVNEPGTSLSVITASAARIELSGGFSDLNLSTAKLAGNTQQAIAAANVGVNTTTVDANLINSVVAGPGTTTIDPADVSGNPSATATAGNAISSSQILDLLDAASGPIFAAVDGVGTGFVISVGNDASASTVTNENNAAKALAIGNEVDNAMSLSANSILTADEGLRQVGLIADIQEVLDPEGGIRFIVSPDTSVAPEIDVSTVAFLDSLGFRETVTGSGIYTQTVVVDTAPANELAALFGVDLTAPTIGLEGPVTIAVPGGEQSAVAGAAGAIASLQIFEADMTATAMAAAGQGVRTLVGDDVLNATVSTSSNRIEATATGNTGQNSVMADATTIDTSADGSGIGATASATPVFSDQVATTGAGFELSSVQIADGSITATLRTGVGASTSAASIATEIADDIDDSTVMSNSNTLQASATGNEISAQTNEIAVSGNKVATTTALANTQSLLADVSAVVGAARTPDTVQLLPTGDFETVVITPAVPSEAFDVTGTVVAGIWEGNIGSLSDAQKAAFISAYGSQPGWFYDSTTGVVEFESVGDGNLTLSAVTPEIPAVTEQRPILAEQLVPGTPGSGGVIVFAGEDIRRSTLTVDANTARGTVTGNIATNLIDVSATNLDSGSTLTSSTAAGDQQEGAVTTIGVAKAEHALANAQIIGGSELSTTVAATFAVDGDMSFYSVTDSTLSVSANKQYATTRGNVVTNTVELAASNMETGAAISSLQSGGSVYVTADSAMDVYAPMAMSGSTVMLNDNRNEAVATVNTATNTMTVTPNNVASISSGADVDLLSSLTTNGIRNVATADFAIANSQDTLGAGGVSAKANSFIGNQEWLTNIDVGNTFFDAGMVNSTATVDGNVTLAQGSANRAESTLTLDGGASSTATGAVLNVQRSDASVLAEATAVAGIGLSGEDAATDPEAADGSSLSVSSNVASAQARGNVSTNTLNASAVALNANSAGATVGLDSGGNVSDTGISASHAVLNNQSNDGVIEARVTDSVFAVNLVGQDVPAALNAQGSAMGNVVQASAVANAATNTLTISALSHGSTGAIGNEQVNTGDVMASVSNSMIGIAGGSLGLTGVRGSTLSATGNSISASATGNSAISTINRN